MSSARHRLHRMESDSLPAKRWEAAQTWSGHGQSTADRVETARRSGYDAGYEAGRREARSEGEAGLDADHRSVCTALLDAAATVARTRAEIMADISGEVVELALELAQALLDRELSLRPDIDTDAVVRALQLAPSGSDLLVRLHPDHTAELAAIERAASGARVTVVEDASVDRGGCILEAGSCRIDTQISTAMARARSLIATAGTGGEDQ